MDTLADLLLRGNDAEAAGAPLLRNWPQVRAALLFLVRVVGLEHVRLADLPDALPESIEDFGEMSSNVAGRRAYAIARRELFRLLALEGYIEAPWEALRMHLRAESRDDLEQCLWAVAGPARRAGMAPSQVQASWVWSLEAEREIDSIRKFFRDASDAVARHPPMSVRIRRQIVEARRALRRATFARQSLRRAIVAFDELFDIESIAASGLLPPRRIGRPPSYDRRGRPRTALPPILRRLHDAAPAGRPTNLPEVWQAICSARNLELPGDPTADDLLAPETWDKVCALPASLLGVAKSTWTTYLRRAEATLLPHATVVRCVPETEGLPPFLRCLATNQREKWALSALWRRLECPAFANRDDWSVHAILDLEVWREIWHVSTDGLSAPSRRQYEISARKLLLRHAPDREDPLLLVRRSWNALPAASRAELMPIRRPAERALLRPADLTPDWLANTELPDSTLDAVRTALARLDRPGISSDADVAEDPVAVAWETLGRSAREHGMDIARLSVLATRAVQDRRFPSAVCQTWASETSSSLSYRDNARFREALRRLDGWRAVPALAPLLPRHAIGELPDRRRKGNRALPERLATELEAVGLMAGHAANTRREDRSVVRELFTRAAERNFVHDPLKLDDLLRLADTVGLAGRKLRRVEKLLSGMTTEVARAAVSPPA
jgi:hypothetical protein